MTTKKTTTAAKRRASAKRKKLASTAKDLHGAMVAAAKDSLVSDLSTRIATLEQSVRTLQSQVWSLMNPNTFSPPNTFTHPFNLPIEMVDA